MNFYSQQGEDKWISENIELPTYGFYVDIGAGHPFTTSNTAFLRDRKWEGLAIDGNRAWADDWKDIPAFCCAVISGEPEVSFSENGWWSRIDGPEAKLRSSITIEELLLERNIGKIDFLSVDTEGSELDVLKMFDFRLHDPAIVVAEYNAQHLPIVGPDQSPIPSFMESLGYSLRHVCEPVNMIFTR